MMTELNAPGAYWFTFRRLVILFWLWSVTGVVLIAGERLPAWLYGANSLFIVLAAICIFAALARPIGLIRLLVTAWVIVGLGLGVEWLGVHSGWPFGAYAYDPYFPPLIWDVPVVIGLAWVVVIFLASFMTIVLLQIMFSCSHPLKRGLRVFPGFSYVVLSTLLTVGIDLVLDPVAVYIGLWQWVDGGFWHDVPLSNFVGWGLVAFLMQAVVYGLLPINQWINQDKAVLRSSGFNKALLRVHLTALGFMFFFTLLALVYHLWLAAWVGLVYLLIIVLAILYSSIHERGQC